MLLEGKFISTESCEGLTTKGKIYEFVNGKTTWDSGYNSDCYESLEHFLRIIKDIPLVPYSPQPKDLLQMGRIVKHQNGDMGFVLKHSILYSHGLNPIHIFREDLTTPSGKYDITEIYESTEVSCFNYDNFIEYLGDLVWKREELTPEQIELKEIENRKRELAEEQKQLADRIAQLKK